MGLHHRNFSLLWHCKKDTKTTDVLEILQKLHASEKADPDGIILHLGSVECAEKYDLNVKYSIMDLYDGINKEFPNAKIIWIQLLPDTLGGQNPVLVNRRRNILDDQIAVYVLEKGGAYIRLQHDMRDKKMFDHLESGDLKLTTAGIELFMIILEGGIVSIMNRGIRIHPNLTQLPKRCNQFVGQNMKLFKWKKKFTPAKMGFGRK